MNLQTLLLTMITITNIKPEMCFGQLLRWTAGIMGVAFLLSGASTGSIKGWGQWLAAVSASISLQCWWFDDHKVTWLYKPVSFIPKGSVLVNVE